MKRGTIEPLWVSSVLVLLGVGLRLLFQEIPNFAPVAAVAMFAGYYLNGQSWGRGWALGVPLSIMLISDRLIGGYQPALMLTNYALLSLPALSGGFLRSRWCGSHGRTTGSNRSAVGGLLGCSLAASLTFFMGSNLMTWMVTPWYPRTAGGLMECFANAIPFFRFTLLGDLCFATLLFGTYAAVKAALPLPTLAREAMGATRHR